jgi:acetyl esterase/lipase
MSTELHSPPFPPRVSTQPLFDVQVEDVVYRREGDLELRAEIDRPVGDGPFPAMISLHGGAWYQNDRTHRRATRLEFARRGVLVVSLDFRMAPEATYPSALQDINFGIRWLKANADELRIDPEAVGIQGESSGGHLAILSALRPDHPSYCTIPNPPGAADVDAEVAWAVGYWPVISPVGRYQYLRELLAQDKLPHVTDYAKPGHEQFWVTEEAMAEGDPVLALERHEPLRLVPVICFQGAADLAHPIENLERFADLYRRAGGVAQLHRPDLPDRANLGRELEAEPDGPVAISVMSHIADFVNGVLSERS